ncbi:hypothetical protein FAI41_03245 [Acetobacteraceae bacterium]|nr:hypothetical protein FAI41_03245 [Acetobacteraceae bacterium]
MSIFKNKRKIKKIVKKHLKKNQGELSKIALDALLSEVPGGRAMSTVLAEVERQRHHKKRQQNFKSLSAFIFLTAVAYAGYCLLKRKYGEKQLPFETKFEDAPEKILPELQEDVPLGEVSDSRAPVVTEDNLKSLAQTRPEKA